MQKLSSLSQLNSEEKAIVPPQSTKNSASQFKEWSRESTQSRFPPFSKKKNSTTIIDQNEQLKISIVGADKIILSPLRRAGHHRKSVDPSLFGASQNLQSINASPAKRTCVKDVSSAEGRNPVRYQMNKSQQFDAFDQSGLNAASPLINE